MQTEQGMAGIVAGLREATHNRDRNRAALLCGALIRLGAAGHVTLGEETLKMTVTWSQAGQLSVVSSHTQLTTDQLTAPNLYNEHLILRSNFQDSAEFMYLVTSVARTPKPPIFSENLPKKGLKPSQPKKTW